MIFVKNDLASNVKHFGEALKEGISLSEKFQTTVVLMWNDKPVIIDPNDSKFISNLQAYYDYQRVYNNPQKFIDIAKLVTI